MAILFNGDNVENQQIRVVPNRVWKTIWYNLESRKSIIDLRYRREPRLSFVG